MQKKEFLESIILNFVIFPSFQMNDFGKGWQG